MNDASSAAIMTDSKPDFNERLIRTYPLFISLFFLASVPFAVIYTKEWDFFENFWHILTSPCKLITDYFAVGGLGSTLCNAAICCLLAYLNIVFVIPAIFPMLPAGVGFTGPTVGVIFAALTFAADGQHPRNVAPIVVGYLLLWILVVVICLVSGMDIPWALSTRPHRANNYKTPNQSEELFYQRKKNRGV